MPKINNQSGFAQLLILAVLVLGIFTAVFLSQKTQIFSPKANEVLSTQQTSAPIKIMPLGDSITHGVKNASSDPENVMAGYRYYLYKNLINAGFNIDMVGALQSGPSDLADRDNEGHNGYECVYLKDLITNSLNTYKPDFVLLLCGINNLAHLQTESQTLADISGLIDKISEVAPNTKIIVSNLTPSDLYYVPQIQEKIINVNNQLPSLISQKASQGKKVYFANMYNFMDLHDISDHVHPNENGYQKMAQVWQTVLTPLLAESGPSALVARDSYIKPGTTQTVSWSNLKNNNGASWIGLFKPDVPDSDPSKYLEWLYLGNCSRTTGTPVTSPATGECQFPIPADLSEGKYEFRLFLVGVTFAQKSNQFNVSLSGPPSPSPTSTPPAQNMVLVSPSAISAGSLINVSWQNALNPEGGSWLGLFKSSDPLLVHSNYKEWLYLGNCSRTTGTPVTSPPNGSCQFPIPTGITPGTYEIRMFLQGVVYTSKSDSFQVN